MQLFPENLANHEYFPLTGTRVESPDTAINSNNIRELFPEILFQSQAMLAVLATVAKIAPSHSSVLILGASGTGKELIASAIHRLSSRVHHNFIAINCSAIPESLLEAELFGHEKGSFTGADKQRTGHFGSAHQGTIFLDEIGEMPLRLQAKLLRVLQEKKFCPVGSSKAVEVDVRIIAATNIDLLQAVQEQRFRLDLFYRLNVLPITLPPLKERRDDIKLLLEHFLDQSNAAHKPKEHCYFAADALEVLCRYDWPGNVRELLNLIERLVIMSGGGRLNSHCLPREIAQAASCKGELPALINSLKPEAELIPQQGINLKSFIEDLENTIIRQALARCNNNKNHAAKLLGIKRTTLVERLKKRKIA
jgi:transcriptional regulator with PAS, ATPase and Fis domain